MRDLILTRLKGKGYNVEPYDAINNGVTKKGIKLSGTSASAVIYPADYKTVREAMHVAETIFSQDQPNIDVNFLTSWEYIKEHVILCVQKKSNEPIEKEDYLDFECYMRILIDDLGSCKITRRLMEKLSAEGISADEVWERAYLNTKKDVRTHDVSFFMSGIKLLIATDPENAEKYNNVINNCPFIILHTMRPYYGAAAILYTSKLIELSESWNSDIVVFPSSIHEVFVTPIANDDNNIDYYSEMVCEANAEAVSEDERLSNHAYILRKGSSELEIIS